MKKQRLWGKRTFLRPDSWLALETRRCFRKGRVPLGFSGHRGTLPGKETLLPHALLGKDLEGSMARGAGTGLPMGSLGWTCPPGPQPSPFKPFSMAPASDCCGAHVGGGPGLIVIGAYHLKTCQGLFGLPMYCQAGTHKPYPTLSGVWSGE